MLVLGHKLRTAVCVFVCECASESKLASGPCVCVRVRTLELQCLCPLPRAGGGIGEMMEHVTAVEDSENDSLANLFFGGFESRYAVDFTYYVFGNVT